MGAGEDAPKSSWYLVKMSFFIFVPATRQGEDSGTGTLAGSIAAGLVAANLLLEDGFRHRDGTTGVAMGCTIFLL